MDPNLITAPLDALFKSPASLLVIACVSIVAFVLELWPKFPSRFVVVICLLLGMLLFPYMAQKSIVPPSFPNPTLVLAIAGFCQGFAAAMAHKYIIKTLIRKFAPQLLAEENKTDITDPPK